MGDRHLRKLAEAGISHVHLLPSFDFGSVPERPEDRKEPELPSSLDKKKTEKKINKLRKIQEIYVV